MITARDKLTCVERELRLRERVYDRMVDKGRMSKRQSDHEIDVMAAIVEDYRQLVMFEDSGAQINIETKQAMRRRS